MSATKRTLSTRIGMVLATALLALPVFAGTATAAPAAPSDVCQQLSDQLTGLIAQITSLSEQADAPGLPIGDLTDLLGAIDTLQGQADSISAQLGGLVCSAIPGGTPGGSATESTPTNDYSTPSTYNSGHRWYPYDYYDTTAPVVTTQVVSVPRGGVATGDGSFGE